jgi:hypothetical protein
MKWSSLFISFFYGINKSGNGKPDLKDARRHDEAILRVTP